MLKGTPTHRQCASLGSVASHLIYMLTTFSSQQQQPTWVAWAPKKQRQPDESTETKAGIVVQARTARRGPPEQFQSVPLHHSLPPTQNQNQKRLTQKTSLSHSTLTMPGTCSPYARTTFACIPSGYCAFFLCVSPPIVRKYIYVYSWNPCC